MKMDNLIQEEKRLIKAVQQYERAKCIEALLNDAAKKDVNAKQNAIYSVKIIEEMPDD